MNSLKAPRITSEELSFPSEIYQLRVDSIRPNRAQPRAKFDNNAIIKLADSIRRYGILQPLTVRPTEDDELYSYELIAGERRLRAAKMLGYFTVPCVIMLTDEQTSAEMAIIENLLREDLNMFEQAYGFKKLIENHRLTQEEVARRMSLSQSAVANKLRLLKLTYEEQKLILESDLTERHARALLKIEDPQDRIETIHFIINNKLNVQQTEEYIESRFIRESIDVTSARRNTRRAQPPTPETAEEEAKLILKSAEKEIDMAKRRGRRVNVSVMNNIHTVDITLKISK